jgi:hypothetical protein
MFGETAAPEMAAALAICKLSIVWWLWVGAQCVSAEPELTGAMTKESDFRSRSFWLVEPGMFTAAQTSW